jgi:ribonucleoside-diphosphate reductase alpha chain
MQDFFVVKRDGHREPFNYNKYNQMLAFLAEGLDVDLEKVKKTVAVHFYDGIKTTDVHDSTITGLVSLISKKELDYNKMAGRALMVNIRKEAYGQYEPIHLQEQIDRGIEKGIYEDFYKYYSKADMEYLNTFITHEKDLDFTYKSIRTFTDKYLLKDIDRIFESPQMLNMLVAMLWRKDGTLDDVISFYQDLRDFKVSLPTPVMSGLRTPIKGYASCCLIEPGDTKEGLTEANKILVLMAALRSGIGVSGVRIRSLGSLVAKRIKHTGIQPIFKWFEGAVYAFSQGSRNNSATAFKAIWDLEIKKVLLLKSNKSTEENSVKGLQYGILIPRIIFTRAFANEDFTLFSAHEVPKLLENLGDIEKWEEQYIAYENDPNIRKEKISAKHLLEEYAKAYFEIGRVYPLFINRANQGPFKVPVTMSNLCMEILLPTKPIMKNNDTEAEVPLCVLANINAGWIDSLDELPRLTKHLVRGLANMLEDQTYPHEAVRNAMENGRYIGVGVSDWMHYLAKRDVTYNTKEGLDVTEEFAEHLQYNLLKASMELAKEKGEAPWFRERSKYADGWLPNDGKWRFISHEKWEQLRSDIQEYGLYNLALSAIPPAGTSSDVSNSFQGIDVARDPLTAKKEKFGSIKRIVPDYDKYNHLYTYADDLDMFRYIDMLSKFTMYIDQSISTNVYISELNDMDEDGKYPLKNLIKILWYAHEKGLRSLYYLNLLTKKTKSDDEDFQEETEEITCEGGACSI